MSRPTVPPEMSRPAMAQGPAPVAPELAVASVQTADMGRDDQYYTEWEGVTRDVGMECW